jgi:phospholipid/cholesterol/gamma-HCH transport system substrate-binding protein
MSRNLAWRDLKTGTIAFFAIVGLAMSILLFARVGALHGDTTNIYVVTDDAPGVLNGTEVWLSGTKVGLVRDIHFRSVSTDTTQRLAIHLEVLTKHMQYLRRDAWADIRPGGNLIGSPVVWISSGTSTARGLQEGDTLVEISTGMMKPVGERMEALGARLTSLADSGSKVLRLLQSQAGAAGRLVGTGWPRVTQQTDQIARLARTAMRGGGTLDGLMHGEIGTHIANIRATKDSISLLLNTPTGNIGRLRADSSLTLKVAHLQGQVDSLRAVLGAAGGIANLRSDSTMTAEIARVRVELAALMADIKKHPLRYIRP